MKRIIILFAIFLLLPSTVFSFGFDNWSKKDYALQATASVLHTVDWLQTREIATNDKYRENNPILDEDPSLRKVNLYMGATLISSWLVADLLSPKWRTRFQYLHIGIEGYVVSNNVSLDIGFKF